jgi:Xaa-Pro aminopeptidase
MRKEIVERLTRSMRAQGFDAMVCLSPENFAYVAGFVVPSQKLMRWRHAATVVSADGRTAFLAVDMEETTVRSRANGVELRVWGEFTDDPMEVLATLLTDMDLGGAAIGIEFDYLFAGDCTRLRKRLPEAQFLPAERYLAGLRQIKTVEEIALLRRLARIADESIRNALADAKRGGTEMDIAAALTRDIYALGAEDFTLMIVATGERSVFPNVGPTKRALEEGDVCRVEIFPIISGYHAGVCRTGCVGRPPRHAEEIWQNLVECKYLVLDMIKPGASTMEIYQAFIAHLGKLNLPPISFVGHGIGLHLHEEPYLGRYSDGELQAGMVLGIEPLVYDTGHGFGMQNKDMVLVTDTGSELLSDFTDTDRLIAIR